MHLPASEWRKVRPDGKGVTFGLGTGGIKVETRVAKVIPYTRSQKTQPATFPIAYTANFRNLAIKMLLRVLYSCHVLRLPLASACFRRDPAAALMAKRQPKMNLPTVIQR